MSANGKDQGKLRCQRQPAFSGTVTGGTGDFEGVTGTIQGTTNGTLTRMQFTITYS